MRAAGSTALAALLVGLLAAPAWAAGELALLSDPPGADVMLDGRMIGSTPLRRSLPAGQYILGVTAPGRRSVQMYVTVVEGLATRRFLSLPGGASDPARAAARARAEVARENARRARALEVRRAEQALARAAAKRREQEGAASERQAAVARERQATANASGERRVEREPVAARKPEPQGASVAARRAERLALAERLARAEARSALLAAEPVSKRPPAASVDDAPPVLPAAPSSRLWLFVLGVGLLGLALGLLPTPAPHPIARPRPARLDDPDLVAFVENADWAGVVRKVEATLRHGGLTHDRLYHLGLARQRLHQPFEAEAAYRAALQHDPRDCRAALNLAIALEALGDEARALIAYRDLVARHPQHGAGWTNLARLLEQTGQRSAADRAWRSAWRAAPADPGLAGAALRSLFGWARRPGRTAGPTTRPTAASHPARAA